MSDVVAWYEEKTPSILEKYGPGPRVHFHTGLVDTTPAGDDLEALRGALVAAQERMLARAATLWEADRHLSGRVLDVGCGLGGGSLYWAGEHGARVTALTIVPGHLPWVARFAAEAGVADRVEPRLGDAHEVEGSWDAAVAIDASCYLDRERWFARLARVLPPGGRVHVEDTFAVDPAMRAPFDAYWRTRVGSVAEYVAAADAAGFALVSHHDLSAESAAFWELAMRWSRARLAGGGEQERLARSLAWQSRLLSAWAGGGVACALLGFERR